MELKKIKENETLKKVKFGQQNKKDQQKANEEEKNYEGL